MRDEQVIVNLVTPVTVTSATTCYNLKPLVVSESLPVDMDHLLDRYFSFKCFPFDFSESFLPGAAVALANPLQ